MKHRNSLSLKKFESLITANEYELSRLYCESNVCLFAEVKSPTRDCVLFILIPEKYILKVSHNHPLRVPLSKKEDVDNRHHQYWMMMKGGVLEKDLVCIATNTLTRFYPNGDAESYDFVEVEEKPTINNENDDRNDGNTSDEGSDLDIEKRAEKLFRKMDTKKNVKHNNTKTKKIDKPNSDEEIEPEIEDGIIFEDKDGNEIESDGEISNEDESDIESVDSKSNESDISDDSYTESNESDVSDVDSEITDDDISDISNISDVSDISDVESEGKDEVSDIDDIPIHEEIDIYLGVIYLCVDLNHFYKHIKEIEKELVEFNNDIAHQEKEIRKTRVERIYSLIDTLKDRVRDKMDEYKSEENKINDHLPKLIEIFSRTDEIYHKLNGKSKDLNEVKTIRKETKEMIREFNSKLLQNRDDIDGYLNDYTCYLQDMLTI